jgi:hypothetical protein
MDYKGYNDRDEEELDPNNPWQTETTKKVKRIFKIILYSISFIVYTVVFFVIFSSCNPGMFDKMFFSEHARQQAQQNPGSFMVYKLQPRDFMNYDGSIELANMYYAKNAEELEIGVKYNLKKITDGRVEGALVFVLEDSNGNYYTTVNEVYDSNRKYGYARVTFGSVKLTLPENAYYKYTESYDYLKEYNAKSNTSSTNSENEENNGVTYHLYIYSYDKLVNNGYAEKDENGSLRIDFKKIKENEVKEISVHEIYNNNTVITLEDYQYD